MIKTKIIPPFLLTLFLSIALISIVNQKDDGIYQNEIKNAPQGKIELIKVNKIARVTCYTDKGIMANGDYVYPGAVAFSDRSVPLNQVIYVEGFGEMVIADRTSKWVHTNFNYPTIDIWMTEEECKEFGLKYLSYTLIE